MMHRMSANPIRVSKF